MKNLTILCILMIASFASEAQVFNYDTRSEVIREEQRSKLHRRKLVDNHILSMKAYKYKAGTGNENAAILDYEISYDTKGNMIEVKDYNKHGKLKDLSLYKWNDNNKSTEFTWLRPNGKMHYTQKYAYDATGNLVDTKIFWKRPDNNTWHTVSTYDDRQNMTEMKTLKGDDKKLYSTFIYTYYEDGSKKQTLEYNGKGKIKHTWNYDCDPAGKLTEMNFKDTSKICIRYETDKDGNRIKIKEESVQWGPIARTVSKYDGNDNLLEYSSYNQKGKLRDHSIHVYNAKNQITEYTLYKKKSSQVKEHNIYHYDQAGIITELITYKDKSTPGEVLKYNYTKAQ